MIHTITFENSPVTVGKYRIAACPRALPTGRFAAQVSVASGRGSASTDRVMCFTNDFATRDAAASFSTLLFSCSANSSPTALLKSSMSSSPTVSTTCSTRYAPNCHGKNVVARLTVFQEETSRVTVPWKSKATLIEIVCFVFYSKRNIVYEMIYFAFLLNSY